SGLSRSAGSIGIWFEAVVGRICERVPAARRNVHQTGLRVVRHRRPVVRTATAGRHWYWVLSVLHFSINDGASGLLIHPLRPSNSREGLRGDKLARDAIEHIEEAILVGLHDDLARPAIDVQIREDHLLHAVVIPFVAGYHLVVPLELARIHVYG